MDGGAGGVELRVELDLGVVPALRLVGGELAQRGLDVVEELGEELLLGASLLHGAVGVVRERHRIRPASDIQIEIAFPVPEEAQDRRDVAAGQRFEQLLQRLADRDEVLQ